MTQSRTPPHPLIRALSGVLAVSFLCVWAWGMNAIVAIRADFDAYLASDNFTVQATQVQSLAGPLNALIPSSYNASTLNLAAPTDHQKWWALMSDEALRSPDTEDVQLARTGVFYLVLAQMAASLLKPVHAVLRNQPNTIATVANGLELTVGMAMLGALYPMAWDGVHGLVLIMYVPVNYAARLAAPSRRRATLDARRVYDATHTGLGDLVVARVDVHHLRLVHLARVQDGAHRTDWPAPRRRQRAPLLLCDRLVLL